jgi:hypothetical protein
VTPAEIILAIAAVVSLGSMCAAIASARSARRNANAAEKNANAAEKNANAAEQAKDEARQAALLAPRAEAIDHLRRAVSSIQRSRVVNASDILSMTDAKDRADLVFKDTVTGDLARAIERVYYLHHERFAGATPPTPEAIDGLIANLEDLITRMKADAALR